MATIAATSSPTSSSRSKCPCSSLLCDVFHSLTQSFASLPRSHCLGSLSMELPVQYKRDSLESVPIGSCQFQTPSHWFVSGVFRCSNGYTSSSTLLYCLTLFSLVVACIIASQKGGYEVRKARTDSLEISVKGKTKEGVLDVLTTGRHVIRRLSHDKSIIIFIVCTFIKLFPNVDKRSDRMQNFN